MMAWSVGHRLRVKRTCTPNASNHKCSRCLKSQSAPVAHLVGTSSTNDVLIRKNLTKQPIKSPDYNNSFTENHLTMRYSDT